MTITCNSGKIQNLKIFDMTIIRVILPYSSLHNNLKTSPKRKGRTISKLPGGGGGGEYKNHLKSCLHRKKTRNNCLQ